MAINVYGLPATVGGIGTIDLTPWQTLRYIEQKSQWVEGISDQGSGLACAATGTRGVQISTGKAAMPGLLVDVTTTQNVTCAANGSGNPRVDLVVLRVDTTSTYSAGGTVAVKQGTPAANPIAPTATQTLGGTWETALCRATVAPSATTVVLEDCRPMILGPAGNTYRAGSVNFNTATVDGSSTVETVVSGISPIPDPGRPYRLDVRCEFGVNDSRTNPTTGHTNFFLYINGTKVETFKTCTGNSDSAVMTRVSNVVSGQSSVVEVRMKPIAVPAGSTIALDTAFCSLSATVQA